MPNILLGMIAVASCATESVVIVAPVSSPSSSSASAVHHDLDSLSAPDLKVYDTPTNSLRAIEVGWPLLWLAARYNRKHVFATATLADPNKLRSNLGQFTNKAKCRHHLSNQHGGSEIETSEPSLWRALRALPTPECAG